MAFVDKCLQIVPVTAERLVGDTFDEIEIGEIVTAVEDFPVVGLYVEYDVIDTGFAAFVKIYRHAVAVGETQEIGIGSH